MKKINLLLLCLVPILQACSWQEYFIISNKTNSEIIIEYELNKITEGNGLFDNKAASYKLDKNGDINWEEPQEVLDTDSLTLTVKLILPANTVVSIGNLSNDHYKKYNQEFINGRVFNLKRINIQSNNTTLEILPENFDSHFSKKDGNILLNIK